MTHLTYQVYLGPNIPLTCLVTTLKGTFTLYLRITLSLKTLHAVISHTLESCANWSYSVKSSFCLILLISLFFPLPHAESEVTDFHCTGIHWGCSGFLVGMINNRPHPLITSIHILQCSCSSMQHTSFHVSFSIQCVYVKWRYKNVLHSICVCVLCTLVQEEFTNVFIWNFLH